MDSLTCKILVFWYTLSCSSTLHWLYTTYERDNYWCKISVSLKWLWTRFFWNLSTLNLSDLITGKSSYIEISFLNKSKFGQVHSETIRDTNVMSFSWNRNEDLGRVEIWTAHIACQMTASSVLIFKLWFQFFIDQ